MIRKSIIALLLVANWLMASETTQRIVGPGTTYYHYVDRSRPLSVHILEVDLTTPHLDIITQKAKSTLNAREKTSVMAEQLALENNPVVAAINGDFFSKTGKPVGTQVADGVMVKKPFIRSVFGLTKEGAPFIDILDFSGHLYAEGMSCQIDGVNENRGENELILFNHYMGVNSKTNNWGIEVSAQYIGEPCINDTSYLVVISKDHADQKGNSEIPGYGVILSGHGTKATYLEQNVMIGDTLKLLLQLNPIKKKVVEALGGAPKIVHRGRVKIDLEEEKMARDFSTTRHPRTAVGYNRDESKLMMFVVDGRQNELSIGMTLRELAAFMIERNVYYGINLDGGGSTTMYLRGKVVNSPSDATGERAVSNALVVLCNKQSDQVAFLQLIPSRLTIGSGESHNFRLQLFDQYYNPLKNRKIQWYCPPELGRISQDGYFTAGKNSGGGYIYIQTGGQTDSAYVRIR